MASKGSATPQISSRKSGANTRTVTVDGDSVAKVPLHGNQPDFYEYHRKTLQQASVVDNYRTTSYEDYLRGARNSFVLLWVSSNVALTAVVVYTPALSYLEPSTDGGRGFVYVGVVLWSNLGLLALKLFATRTHYLTKRVMRVWRNASVQTQQM